MKRLGPIAALLSALVPSLAGADQGKPNILIIVTDDHGFGDVGYHNPEIRTPNLDRLAADGVRLERFYAYPTCSLTRAALLTGLSTLRTGVNNRNGLDLKYRTMPEALRAAGYQTVMCGKWHLGGTEDNSLKGPDYYPTRRGFDHFYGFLHGAIDYTDHVRKDLGVLDWQRDGEPVREEGFTTDLLADEAVRRIKERDEDRPLFLYLAFNAVHGPLETPPSGLGEYAAMRDRKRQVLAANVSYMDAAIGRVLGAIDAEGMRDETIVLFFGDNGGQLSQGASNAPLRGEKGQVFEGGTRVPAAIQWPGVLPAGTESRQLLWVADVYPTLARAAGVSPEAPIPFDGLSLWDELQQGRETPRDLIHGTSDLALYHGPWKLIRPRGGARPMLFRIADDPNETADQAEAEPDVVRDLLERLSASVASIPGAGRDDRQGQPPDQPRMRRGREGGPPPRRDPAPRRGDRKRRPRASDAE
ncbi:MAG: arylsulfatase [Gemmatimonadales bacterium]|nr:arylsulfatase [Gemmatimonadales bacterium]